MRRAGRAVLGAYVVLVCGFLVAPIVVAVTLSFSSVSQLRFPPPGLSLQWYAKALATQEFVDGLWTSVLIGVVASALSTVAGTLAAVAINHHRFRGRPLVQALLGLPLVLPTVVLGLALLQTLIWYRLWPGLAATMLGHGVIGVPYVAYLVLATLASYDLSLEQASLGLGATRWQTLRWVTLPLLRPGIVSGALFSFLLSFDNVALSIFLSRGDTLPLRLMQHVQYYADPSVAAVSTALVALSLVVLVVVGRLLGARTGLRLVT